MAFLAVDATAKIQPVLHISLAWRQEQDNSMFFMKLNWKNCTCKKPFESSQCPSNMALLTKVSKRLKVQTVKNYVLFIENLCIAALALTLSCSLESPLLLKCDLEMSLCLTIARPIPACFNDIIDISSIILYILNK